MENFQIIATILLGVVLLDGLIATGIAIFYEPKPKHKKA